MKTVDSEEFGNFTLQDGDSIYIQKILNRYENRVSVEGAIRRPGFYELNEGVNTFWSHFKG